MSLAALHPNVRVRIGVGFVQRLLSSMVLAFMAIHLAAHHGAARAGVMMLIVVSLGVVGILLGGHVADVHGRRSTLLASEVAVLLAFVVMAVANTDRWEQPMVVYCGYAVNIFAASCGMPANDGMIVDVTTPQTRKLVYTVNYWATNLALAIGALLGSFLYHGHFTLLLGIGAGCMLAVLATTVLFLSETKPEPAEGTEHTSQWREFVSGYRTVLGDRLFRRLILAATLGMAIEVQLINYIAVRLAADLPPQRLVSIGSWHVDVDGVEMLGILRAENTALVVVLALASHVLFRRMSDGLRLYLGITLFTGGYMVLAVSDTGWVLLAAALVFTVGELMNVPVKQALLANMVPDGARTRYMAVYTLHIRVALVIAALFITLGSFVAPWVIAALYGLFGAVIVAQYRVLLRSGAGSGQPSATPSRARIGRQRTAASERPAVGQPERR